MSKYEKNLIKLEAENAIQLVDDRISQKLFKVKSSSKVKEMDSFIGLIKEGIEIDCQGNEK